MALSSNAPTLEYWLGAPGTHELKSQMGMQIHRTESPEQCLGFFSLLIRGQFMSVGAGSVSRHQFPDATCVSCAYSRPGSRILSLRWEGDLKRCSISRSVIRSSINTGVHKAFIKLWAGVIPYPQRRGNRNAASCAAHNVLSWLESLVALAAGGIQGSGYCFWV